ncbi:MAG: Arm DNA-binding domain-containing protein [Clostridium sp.]|nr:Arm DNA-binding domain-containing protein [Clostridium sp.]
MASIKVKYRLSTVPGRDGSIFYQIIIDGRVAQLSANLSVRPNEWDASRSTVVAGHDRNRHPFVRSVREAIRRDVDRLCRIVRKFETDDIAFTTADIVDAYLL